MAHFAQLDENNVVLQVVVIGDKDTQDLDGNEVEAIGVLFCRTLFGFDTRWVKTSYNGKIRGRFAGIGYAYHEDIDAFVAPQPFPSWVLSGYGEWFAPSAAPNDGKSYYWDESTVSWIEAVQ